MLNDASDLVNFLDRVKDEESRLTTLLELLDVASYTTLHRLHKVIKVAPTVRDDDLGGLDDLHGDLVGLLQLR